MLCYRGTGQEDIASPTSNEATYTGVDREVRGREGWRVRRVKGAKGLNDGDARCLRTIEWGIGISRSVVAV